MKHFFTISLLLCCQAISFAQDTALTNLLKQNTTTFSPSGNGFTGAGWQKIDSGIKANNNVLIGEDHFFNEVPFFVTAVANSVKFDNFCTEIDPYSAAMLQNKINTLDKPQFDAYKKTFGNTFSFFALQKPDKW